MFETPTFYKICTNVISFFVIATLLKNYFFLLLAPLYPIKEKLRQLKNKKYNYNPKFSVVVPAWNEEIGIIKTMKSVLFNGYENIELIVVNDGSTDGTDKVVHRFIKDLKEVDENLAQKVVYKKQKNGGKGVALNTGIKLATGDIVLTVDADSKLKKGALKNLVKYYFDDNIKAVVGNVQVTNTKTLVGLAQHLEYYLGFYNKRAHSILGAEYIFGGACASFRRDIFRELGGFDTKNKTEDIEMSMRIRDHGYKCTYAEDVICFTEGASDIKGLIAQRVRWKKGRLDTFKKYRHMFFSLDERHNFFLAFFVLPFSMLMEIQLLFEPIAITVLLIYSIITVEYVSLVIGLGFIALVYIVVAVFSNNRVRPGLIIAAPFTWPLFYMLDWIEYMALVKSAILILNKKDVVWQDWDRKGI